MPHLQREPDRAPRDVSGLVLLVLIVVVALEAYGFATGHPSRS